MNFDSIAGRPVFDSLVCLLEAVWAGQITWPLWACLPIYKKEVAKENPSNSWINNLTKKGSSNPQGWCYSLRRLLIKKKYLAQVIVGNESAVCWWRGVEERGGRGLTNAFRPLKVKVSNSLQPHEWYSPPAPSVHGILQTRILEWVAIPVSRGSSRPRDQTQVFHLAGRFFTVWATGEAPL